MVDGLAIVTGLCADCRGVRTMAGKECPECHSQTELAHPDDKRCLSCTLQKKQCSHCDAVLDI